MSQVLELRQYTLHPGGLDALLGLFTKALVPGLRDVGVRVHGMFRDLDDPYRLVWVRGFPNMAARTESLTAFYTGPVWRTHRDEVNAAMIDDSDVLLLRPAAPDPRFGAPEHTLVTATVHHLTEPADDAFTAFFDRSVAPLLDQAGAPPLARLSTEYAPNPLPKLPVRTGEHVFVWVSSFTDTNALAAHDTRLAAFPNWTARAHHLSHTQRLRLIPALQPAES